MARKRKSKSKLKLKYIVVPSCAILAVVILIGIINSLIVEEAVTDKQIIEKDDWTEEELVNTLVRVNLRRKGAGHNPYVLRHLRKQVAKYPEKKRRNVVEKIVLKSIDELQDKWRDMTPDLKSKMVDSMRKEFAKSRKRLEKLEGEKLKKFKEKVANKETQKWARELNAKAINRLSPDNRKEMAPITKDWINTIESL
jgi:acyl-CoA reductase-like NAD-dependent aldehyde dehydrogenase